MIRKLAFAFSLLATPVLAQSTPVQNFQSYVNQTITPNSQSGVTPGNLNTALNMLVPILTGLTNLTLTGDISCVSGNPLTCSVLYYNGLPLESQLLPHRANNSALSAYTKYTQPVVRDGFASPGDGGRATYTHSTSACAASGGDSGSQITAADGGCWNIDWSSVNNVASMPLFGCFGQATDCTQAFIAALNTGKSVYFPTGYYLITTGTNTPGASGYIAGATVTTPGQIIYGDGRTRSKIDCRLPASPGTTNPCLLSAINPALGLPGLDMRDLYMGYGMLPDSATPSVTAPYGPLIFMQGQPGTRLRRMRLERASTDVDLRGNSGQSRFEDIEYNCLATCWFDDGSLDSVRWEGTHGFPWDLTTNQATQFYTLATAFDIGRSDDFRISHGLWIGHLTFNFHSSAQAATAGTAALGAIDHFDCDTGACLLMSAGNVEASGLLSTLGNSNSYAAAIYGGTLDLVGFQMQIGANFGGPAFFVGGSTTIPHVTVNGGSTTYLGTQASQFDDVAYQVGLSSGQTNGDLTIAGHNFVRPLGTGTTSPVAACNQNPVVTKGGSGRLTMIGSRITDLGAVASTGTCPNKFISIPTDGIDRVIGNATGAGWTNTFPASPVTGVYQWNGGTGNALPTTSN